MLKIEKEKCPKNFICQDCCKIILESKEIYYYCATCDSGGTFPDGRELEQNDIKFFRRILKEFSNWLDNNR